MKKYIVVLQNVLTQEFTSTICNNNDELATLISNLDTAKYSVDSIKGVLNVIDELDHFCVKNDKLETGV